ncbi:UDP-N-acetylmuramoyl-L-alanine--D-glutamate ligase [Desulfosarcina sp. OttesenSCG-928-G17]|nr:UDP-N-acetylmuramoyl-L-alanine--D-glutamate ligase [Desulfosarcina sp. OttesenSCG-928-G17]
MGLGRSGIATTRFLAQRGSRVTVVDQAPESRLQDAMTALSGLDVRFRLGSHGAADFENADMVVLSPGVPHTLPALASAREKGIPVIGEMELAASHLQIPMIAITGTNGKTTTTELTGKMLENSGLRVFVGGNIGTPLITCVDSASDLVDVAVVEVSSFQLDTIVRFRPNTAMLLNITPDHLDRYADFSAYAAAKWAIFQNQEASDLAILNGMDLEVAAMTEKNPPRARTCFFSDSPVAAGAWIQKNEIRIMADNHMTASFSLSRNLLTGPHNRENIAAACLAAREHGATDAGIQKTLDTFTGLHHRMEDAGIHRGVRFVNDSKATNVDATKRALECFDEPVILIMGGQNKNCDFRHLEETVQRRVKVLVVMGEARGEIATVLSGKPRQGVLSVSSLKEAVRASLSMASAGDTVLFSPACASFDMFDNYAHRGDAFREAVDELT